MTWKPIDEKAKDGRNYVLRQYRADDGGTVASWKNGVWHSWGPVTWLESELHEYMDVPGLNGEEVPEPVYAWAVNLTGWAGIFYMDRESAEGECATRNFGRDHAKYCVVRVRIEECPDD